MDLINKTLDEPPMQICEFIECIDKTLAGYTSTALFKLYCETRSKDEVKQMMINVVMELREKFSDILPHVNDAGCMRVIDKIQNHLDPYLEELAVLHISLKRDPDKEFEIVRVERKKR